MLRRCTSCTQASELVYFQPRVATTNENKLIKTCFLCRKKQRCRRSTRNNRTVLAELDTNAATICQKRPRTEKDNAILPLSFRQRRTFCPLNTLFSAGVSASLNNFSPIVSPSVVFLPAVVSTPAVNSHLAVDLLSAVVFPPAVVFFAVVPLAVVLHPAVVPPPTVVFPPAVVFSPAVVFPPAVVSSPAIRRLSVNLSDEFFQREHGFANRIRLNGNSIPVAFVHPLNQVHRTRRLDLGGRTTECKHCHALH